MFAKISSMKKIIILVKFLFILSCCNSQELISQFNKTVTFLYTTQNDKYVPYGTGFLVATSSKEQQGWYIYLVTAKHVLYSPNKKPLDLIYARFNTKDSSEMFRVPLVWAGNKKTVFVHPDESIDLAIIPVVLPSNLVYKFIPREQIGKRSEFDSLKINIGTEVFFTGLFTAFIETKNINPIFRFGRLCLMPKEKIEYDGIKRDLLLIESSSFGGNSGSPVIFSYHSGFTNNVRLEGVILGSFNQGQILEEQNQKNLIAWSSLGISAITPSEYIVEILNLPEMVKLRAGEIF